MGKTTQLVLICDTCNYCEVASFELQKKISEDKVDMHDVSYHCGNSMRLTISETNNGPLSNEDINLDTTYWTVTEILRLYLRKTSQDETIANAFQSELLEEVNSKHPSTDYLHLHAIRNSIPNVAKKILTDEISNEIQLILIRNVDYIIQSAENRLRGSRKSIVGPITPGSDPGTSLSFVCTKCDHIEHISVDVQQDILEGKTEPKFPIHHEEEMQLRISITQKPIPKQKTGKSRIVTLLQNQTDIDVMEVMSVGVDVGSSTTHLIFSKLRMERQQGFLNMTNRFNIVDRSILYESEIINTPLLDSETIDIDEILKFCHKEYEKAGYTKQDIQTGAVIVTGETAKKKNADKIVEILSSDTGKFVSATAGPNFESLLAAMGSGTTLRSLELQNTVLSVDIGGGTSNLAISSNGQVLSTSCINVGGRLLGIDGNRKIWRIDEPTRWIMGLMNMNYSIGDVIGWQDLKTICDMYTDALIEVIQGPASSDVAKKLMMTEDLDFTIPIDEIVFCGGVSEFIYSDQKPTGDIGSYIAERLKLYQWGKPVVEPPNKIRATVIGAGSYSLSVSGSTGYYDKDIEFPLNNIPVLKIDAKPYDNRNKIVEKIQAAYARFDFREGKDVVALYFQSMPVIHRDEYLPSFVKAISYALPNSVCNEKMIILIFGYDIGGMVGRTLKKETKIEKNFLSLDELYLEDGDFIDIGAPLAEGHSFPITVKSLAFS